MFIIHKIINWVNTTVQNKDASLKTSIIRIFVYVQFPGGGSHEETMLFNV